MPTESHFHASIADRLASRGQSEDAFRLGEDDEVHEPIEPVLPPTGVEAVRVRDVISKAATMAPGDRLDVAGIRGSAAAFVAASLSRADRPIVFVTEDVDTARRAAADIAFFLGSVRDEEDAEDTGEGDVLVFAGNESSPYADISPDRRAAMARMATLFHLAHRKPWRVLVVPASALARKVVPRAPLLAHTARIVAEDELDRDAIVRSLGDSGYVRVPVVEDPGSFAVRGALLDVWPPNRERPVRVELYGDLVLSIRPFDPFEQRTSKDDAKALREIALPPAREVVLTPSTLARAKERVRQLADAVDWPTIRTRTLMDDVASARGTFGADGFLPAYYDELESLLSYVGDDAMIVLDDPPSLTRSVRAAIESGTADAETKGREPHFLPVCFFESESDIVRAFERRRVTVLHRSAVVGHETDGLASYEVSNAMTDLAARDQSDLSRAVKNARSLKGKGGTLEPLARRIGFWHQHGMRVFIAARAQTQAERLKMLLRHQGVECRARLTPFDPAWLTEDEPDVNRAELIVGSLSRGVVLPADGIVIVTEEEVFGARAHRRKEKKASDITRPFLEDLRSLNVGDFIVHAEHGIGRYQGLVHKEVGGLSIDLIAVEYAGGDKLYLPIYRLNQIQKYAGGENTTPKIDRLGGSTFSKTKSKVRKAVRQMADELLRLYAERQAQPGRAIEAADDNYRAFEATFAYDETPDQARAIDDVNRDLEKEAPMDRLVCGDVGFGKTEVAIRAAFRVALAGRQVALLCPTTVLAQQHLRTFEARMRDYPIVIRAMSRFQTKREHDETIALLKEGKADVVIGTHRLLSKDIHFKDLGLLVVDEEQRFGVAHKERIKQIRAQVDVLTLTATPIPRTLQMAVSGLRDLSLITTPPTDRRAVRTIVSRFDEKVLREAVQRELSRGGQIFYVYNRIEGIYEKAQKLQSLVPEARIAVAHGQMMRGTANGENGALEQVMVDFVEGRYDILVATAIVESGLDIPRANTIIIDRADLFGLAQLYQLRGRVGRSKERAYCYLIVPPTNAMTDESRARIDALERHTELGSGFKIASLDLELRGAGDLLGADQSGSVASVGFDLFCQMLEEAVQEMRGDPVVHDVDTELSFDVTALLPEDYVGDVGVRLSLYKRFASATDEAHVAELAAEMEDRFGPPPEDARRLVQLMTMKTELRRMKALGCEATARSVTLHLREDTPLDAKKILDLVRKPKSPYRLTPDMRLVRRFDGTANGLANAETLLAEVGACLRDDS